MNHLFNAKLPVAAAPPAWRTQLQQSVSANNDANNLYVSLATIKAFGRPANRTVFFRGFLTDSASHPVPSSSTSPSSTAPADRASSTTGHDTDTDKTKDADDTHLASSLDASLRLSAVGSSPVAHAPPARSDLLANVLVFVADARSGSVGDILHGSRFGEVCWFLPHTKEQYRISGSLHLVLSPDHVLSQSHQVPPPFADHGSSRPDVDWETIRLSVWKHISGVRRASFAWPHPGKAIDSSESDLAHAHRMPIRLPSLYLADDNDDDDYSQSVLDPAKADDATELASRIKRDSKIALSSSSSSVLTSEPSHEASSSESPLSSHTSTAASTSTSTSTAAAAGPSEPRLSKTEVDHHHSIALSNFCLLLLEVDGADYLNLSKMPHTRTKFRKVSPDVDDVAYLRQSHVKQIDHWVVKAVNP